MSPSSTAVAGASRARRLRSVVANVVLTAFLAGVVLVFWPTSLGGCSTFTIVSGHSMEPTYYTGDLVWSRCGEPSIGDVVVYQPEDTGGARVIHRIIGGSAADGWVIQGDNNDFLDPWTPSNDQILGSAVLHISGLGRVVFFLASPYLWISLFFLAAGIYVWPRKEDGVATDEPGGSDEPEGGAETAEDQQAEPVGADEPASEATVESEPVAVGAGSAELTPATSEGPDL